MTRMLGRILLSIIIIPLLVVAAACAAPKLAKHQLVKNLPSTLGMNTSLGLFDGAFLNGLKTGAFWNTHLGGSGTGEGGGLIRSGEDANGYPTSLSMSGTFTGCISSVSGACGGSSGTTVYISSIGSGAVPWNGGTLSGAGGGGVTGGTLMTLATGTGTSSSITGSVLTVGGSVSGVFGPGMVVFLTTPSFGVTSTPQEFGTITSNGTGTGGAGTYNLSASSSAGAQSLSARQIEGTAGTYIASVSQHVTGTTITETNTWDRFEINSVMSPGAVVTPPSGNYFQTGTWVFKYDDGDGTTAFSFSDDFSGLTQCTGTKRYVGTVSNTTNGTNIDMTVLGSPYPKNMRLVYSPGSDCSTEGANELLLDSGEIFSPTFLALMRPFKTIRMMDWQQSTCTALSDWTYRRQPTYIFYQGTSSDVLLNHSFPLDSCDGVPIEVQVALCNKLNADCWFNIPLLADDTYITNMASCVHNGTGCSSSGLNSNLKVYAEFSNEIWNQVFCGASQFGARTQGCPWLATNLDSTYYPQNVAGFSNDPTNGLYDYGALQMVRASKLWKAAWGGDAGRVTSIFGGFWGSPSTFQTNGIWGMQTTDPGPNNIGPTYYTGTKASNLNVLAVAPYFSGGCPADLNTYFNTQGPSDVAANNAQTAVNAADAASNSLGIVGYESGQSYSVCSVLTSAMRDSRMTALYTSYYNQQRSAGLSGIINHYSFIRPISDSYWGSLESITETSSPRYNALSSFRN